MTPLEWLESTRVALLIQESAYGFPLVVAVHIVGLTLSVGTLLWVDLRMIGVTLRHVPVSVVYRSVAPWFGCGFLLMVCTGLALFTAYATSAYSNPYFRLKMACILLAGVNALIFHVWTQRSTKDANTASRPPIPVRIAGVASIALWSVVILAGRMMSYTMFSYPG
jgi:multidrug transporter EmrE-like cation transporter